MGREISLFADYSQNENRITNYCGLVLKILYEQSPSSFEVVINRLIEDEPIVVNPVFSQQEKSIKSVPDLCISQKSFAIYFETKIDDWFYDSQLEKHLGGLIKSNAETKILFLLCKEDIENLESRFKQTIELARKNKVTVQPITFEMLLSALKSNSVKASDTFNNIINEFEQYLDANKHLQGWKHRLDVVNCGGTMAEAEKGFYACPDAGGSYKHKRSRYFGAYYDKAVNYIFEIRAVVVVGYDNESGKIVAKSTKWNNTNESPDHLKKEAIENISKADQRRFDEVKGVDLQVFLLGDKYNSAFKKSSSGGMFGSKRYFEGIPNKIATAEELAKILSDKRWEDWDKNDFWK